MFLIGSDSSGELKADFKDLDPNTISAISEPKVQEQAMETLAVPGTPTDIVLDPTGFVTFLSSGPNALRAAAYWVKHHQRYEDPLADLPAK